MHFNIVVIDAIITLHTFPHIPQTVNINVSHLSEVFSTPNSSTYKTLICLRYSCGYCYNRGNKFGLMN